MNEAFDREELVFVFGYLMAQRIVGADGDVHPREAQFLADQFPDAAMRRFGLRDADGRPTARWDHAVDEALLALPALLSVDERLDLVGSLWRAAQADSALHPDEAAAVAHGARLLGVPADQVARRLAG